MWDMCLWVMLLWEDEKICCKTLEAEWMQVTRWECMGAPSMIFFHYFIFNSVYLSHASLSFQLVLIPNYISHSISWYYITVIILENAVLWICKIPRPYLGYTIWPKVCGHWPAHTHVEICPFSLKSSYEVRHWFWMGKPDVQSAFQCIAKLFSADEVRALCRALEFFLTKLGKPGLHGPCLVHRSIVMLKYVLALQFQ